MVKRKFYVLFGKLRALVCADTCFDAACVAYTTFFRDNPTVMEMPKHFYVDERGFRKTTASNHIPASSVFNAV